MDDGGDDRRDQPTEESRQSDDRAPGTPLVGVVGRDDGGTVADAVTDAGGRVVADDLEAVLEADPAFVAAVGESATLAACRALPAPPVLPVDAGPGVRSVRLADVRSAVASLVTGDVDELACPVLDLAVGDDHVARAAADAALVSEEAAHISEYGVATPTEGVATFRADGVVVATPVGSTGYARRVDGPVIGHGTDVAAVVPVAPFATDPDHWVLPVEELQLSVERDEVAVELHADERARRRVGVGEPVTVTVAGRATLAVLPESRSHFST